MSDSVNTEPQGARRRAPVPLVLFAVVGLVVLFFTAWRMDWFGREMTDQQVLESLTKNSDAREVQHALAQLEQRLSPRYEGREKFRSALVALQGHERWEIRRQVAWVMGREPADEYHRALLAMLVDDDPGVRRNAACALSNFNEPAAREVLLSALEPVRISTPEAGTLDLKLKVGDTVSIGRALGSIKKSDGKSIEVRAAFNGTVLELPKTRTGEVNAGDVITVISADPQSVVNVLVALRAVGTKEDVPKLQALAEAKVAHMSKEVPATARETIEILTRR